MLTRNGTKVSKGEGRHRSLKQREKQDGGNGNGRLGGKGSENKGKEAGRRWGRREEAWGEKRLENITRRQEIRGCHTPAFPVGAASGQALCTSASGFTPSEAEGDPGTHHRGCRLFLRHSIMCHFMV